MKKVLIIGGAGFIGLHLAKKLIQEYNVDILDNFSRAKKDEDLDKFLSNSHSKMLDVDALNTESIMNLDKDYNYIFQLAAIVGVKNVNNFPYDTIYKNFMINHNALLLAKLQKNLEKFIFSSTSEVQSSSAIHLKMTYPTPENFPICLPDLKTKRSTYMLSKIYGEAMCFHRDIPSIILRPHNIYGPRMGMSHVIPELLLKFKQAERNTSLKINSLDHQRAFCYIDDAVNMMIELMNNFDKTPGTEVFNIGNDTEEVSIRKLTEILLKIVGRDDIKILTDIDTTGSPSRRCPDMSKTTSISGVSPAINIFEGCNKTWEWYRKSNL